MSEEAKKTNRLFVISAPSGCGKGTILSRVFGESGENDDVYYSVSYTTREPREGEVNGKNYNFVSKEEFRRLIDEGEFFEYAQFAGNFYGTGQTLLRAALAEGKDAILEIETQGAFQVKKLMPEAVLIFILPPSVNELERRLKKRGTETDEVIEKRVSQAAGEIRRALEYDYVMMNDELEKAVEDFEAIVSEARGLSPSTDRFKTVTEINKEMIREVLKNA